MAPVSTLILASAASAVPFAEAEYHVTLMSGKNVTVAGVKASASCPGSTNYEACKTDGSSNYHSSTVKLNANTGIFEGTLTTNQCSNDHYGYCPLCDPPQYLTHTHMAFCIEVTLPSHTGPALAPLRGPVGYTVQGVNIFGPEEDGFGTGMNPKPCSDGSGICPGGMDVPTCESSLDYTCGQTGSTPVHALMLDTCGGHAMPYHYHNDDACDYDHKASGHSPLIGWGLDGVGIYGIWEDNPTAPDLDACNGHVGPVPADNEYGVPAGTVMYHYHVSSNAPYTLGCYGNAGLKSNPISQEQCKTLYPKCNQELAEVVINNEHYCYDLDCPCFDGRKDRLGRNTESTSCLSPSPSPAPTPTPSPPTPTPPAPTPSPSPSPFVHCDKCEALVTSVCKGPAAEVCEQCAANHMTQWALLGCTKGCEDVIASACSYSDVSV